MDQLEEFLFNIKNWIWGPPLLMLLLGTGIFLTILLKGMQFRYLGFAIRQVFAKGKIGVKGDISAFEALMTSLAGAIGTGTIVGVATAISIGGFGSLFWMWVTAFFGMATKYAESLLAVKYRITDKRGEMIGGPMEYIDRGLGWRFVAILFALFGSIAAIGTGNLVQVNAIAEAAFSVWQFDHVTTGITVCILTALVIVGGVKSIGHVAGVLVPLMATFYLLGGFAILVIHYEKIPDAFLLIFTSAFDGQAATGGFVGATVMMALQMGVSRSVFSNEAGLGISSIAAAAAKTDNPGRQAMITMTGALVSTVIVCTVTGLAMAVTGVQGQLGSNGNPLSGATMAITAFKSTITGGEYIVSIGLILFAFSTMIAWAYYGEKCFEYLFGEKAVIPYRLLFILLTIPGAALKLETVWFLADISNGLMVIPNLIAVIALSSVIVHETNIFLKIANQEDFERRTRIKKQ